VIGGALLEHLRVQLDSARRLLDLVLEQGRAVRKRDVEGVLSGMSAVQVEMERRGRLERDRAAILTHAGQQLGVPAHAVTLDAMTALLAPADAEAARARSAELRGVLTEVGREHAANRALMKQELAFLDHLTRMLGGGDHRGYQSSGRMPSAPPASTLRALDLTA
jgi:hypothetical protein